MIIHCLRSQTLWIYDPSTWRSTPNSELNIEPFNTPELTTLQQCKDNCTSKGLECASITWNGDIDSNSDQGTCNLYVTKFGFPSNGFILENSKIGEGIKARLQFKENITYFEKPMDLELNSTQSSSWDQVETLQHHLICHHYQHQ